MAFDYTRMLNTASRLIQRFGGDFSYTQVVKGAYDPVNRTQAGTDVTKTVKGVFIGPKQTFIDGTVVEKGEARFIMDAKGLTITPEQGDTMVENSKTYFVHNVREVDPSGAKILVYILELKAG